MDADHARHTHDLGLAADLSTLLRRRRMLALIAGIGLVPVVGCDSGGSSTAAPSTTGSTGSGAGSGQPSATAGTTQAASCEPIPGETAGPYPGDGSNGPNILTESGIVRSDIRSSFGSSSGVADGVPLTIELTLVGSSSGCAPLAGAAVYLWQCDRDGAYSMYDRGAADQNYLRGVQEADGSGVVTFTSVFPAAYAGRWPHAHFEVYPSLAKATSAADRIVTSQLALPKAACDEVYATDGYSGSAGRLARSSLESDTVFRDGHDRQLAAVTGSVSAGYRAALTVPV